MIGEITPLVQAAGRRTWSKAAIAHVAGAASSAAFLGLLLGSAGLLLGLDRSMPGTGVLIGATLLACSLRDAGVTRVRLPSLHRQTPRWFRAQFTPIWYGLLWGADLGQGWTTRILFTGYYGLVLWAVLSADPRAAALVLGAYGLGRVLPVLVAGLRDLRPAQVIAMPIFQQPLLQQVNAAALALAGAFFIAAFS